MKTDRQTRTRIAAMAAAETAIERDPRDPFNVLAETCRSAAATLGVDPEEVYRIADTIVVETMVDTHLGPSSRSPQPGSLYAG